MRRYSIQWRRPYRRQRLRRSKAKRITLSTGMLVQAAKLYKRGVKANDTEALLAAGGILDEYDRRSDLQDYLAEQSDTSRAIKLMRRALKGDVNALVTVLKITGDLPQDYTLKD